MNLIKKKWHLITLIYLLASYLFFIIYMDKRTDYLTYAAILIFVATLVLFIGTFIGSFGIIFHTFFKKEALALPFYRSAYTLGTTNPNILAAYGVLQLKNFNADDACTIFEKGLSCTSNYLYIKTLTGNRALCYWKQGKLEKALSSYEDLFYYPDLEIITDFSLENLDEGTDKNGNFYAQDFVTMGYLAFINNQREKATYYTHVALKLSDIYAPAYDNLGQFAYSDGNLEEAQHHFKHALELKPSMIDSQFFLAQIAYDQNDAQGALDYLNAIDINSINGLSTISQERIDELKASCTV